MADSDTVVTDDLDAFSELMFGGSEPEEAVVTNQEDEEGEETSEIETPSATEGKESEAPGDPEPDTHDEDEETVEGEESDLLKIKPRKSAKERIAELTAARREADRRADALARELEEARRPKDTSDDVSKTKVNTAPLDNDAPNPEDTLEDGTAKYPLGEFDPHYIRDLTRFTIKSERERDKKEEAVAQERKQMEQAEQELTTSWSTKLKAAVEELPDLPTKAVELEDTFRDLDPNYGKYLASTIMSLELGPHVLDYLADHIDEARAIVASGPTQATIAFGRLEAQIASARKGNEVEKGKVSTSAPPPPPRTRGSGGTSGIRADTEDLDAFEKAFFLPKRR